MNEAQDHAKKKNNSNPERQTLHDFTYMRYQKGSNHQIKYFNDTNQGLEEEENGKFLNNR